MSDSVKVRVTRKYLTRVEKGKKGGRRTVKYVKGDRLTVSELEFKRFSDRLALDEGKDAPEPEEKEEQHTKDEDKSVRKQVRTDVESSEDVEFLRAVALDLDIEYTNRWGVKKLREAILEVLGPDEEDEGGGEE